MNCIQALNKVQESYLRNYGTFFRPLTDFGVLTLRETCILLQTRGRVMIDMANADMISPFDISRFSLELDVISLLCVICLWGTVSDDVPITEEDLGVVDSAIHCECAAGASDDKNVSTVLKKLIEEGLRTNLIPRGSVERALF